MFLNRFRDTSSCVCTDKIRYFRRLPSQRPWFDMACISMKPLDRFKTLSSCVYPDRTSILSHNIFSDPNQVVFVPNRNRNITTLLSRHKIKDLTQRSIHYIQRPEFSTLILAIGCNIHNVTFILSLQRTSFWPDFKEFKGNLGSWWPTLFQVRFNPTPLQDSAPCHSTKTAQDWSKDHDQKLKASTWLPNSPDTNPVEHGNKSNPWRSHLKTHRSQKIQTTQKTSRGPVSMLWRVRAKSDPRWGLQGSDLFGTSHRYTIQLGSGEFNDQVTISE